MTLERSIKVSERQVSGFAILQHATTEKLLQLASKCPSLRQFSQVRNYDAPGPYYHKEKEFKRFLFDRFRIDKNARAQMTHLLLLEGMK